jgi:hypothetical protein
MTKADRAKGQTNKTGESGSVSLNRSDEPLLGGGREIRGHGTSSIELASCATKSQLWERHLDQMRVLENEFDFDGPKNGTRVV